MKTWRLAYLTQVLWDITICAERNWSETQIVPMVVGALEIGLST